MLIVKIVTTLIVVSLTPFVMVRDWRYHDRRTRRHALITQGIVISWAIGSLGSIWIIWNDEHTVRQAELNETRLNAKVDELITGKNELRQQIAAYQSEVQSKDLKIASLQTEVQKAGRGVASTYDFDGALRSSAGPGKINVDFSGQAAFNQLARLQDERNWQGLLRFCDKQIVSTPGWLTPYMFRGLANANLGNPQKAADDLERVVKDSLGNPAYSQAKDLLEKLRK